MASIINAGTTTLTPIQITGDTSGILQLQTNGGTTAVTIDTSQRVGIGTSSPSRTLQVIGTVAPTYSVANDIQLLLSTSTTATNISSTYGSTGSFVPLTFSTNSAVQMTLDTSGNLGLGVTPSAWNTSYKALEFPNGTGVMAYSGGSNIPDFHIFENAYLNNSSNWVYKNSGYKASRIDFNNGSVSFAQSTDATQTAGSTITFATNMTLDNSGHLFIGTTSALINESTLSAVSSGNTVTFKATGSAANNPLLLWNNAASGTIYLASFFYGSSVTSAGSITTNGTTTTLNQPSDYRLKNIIGELTTSGSFIDALQPKVGTFKSDGSPFVGFIADEVQLVSPSSVQGTKDATREEQYEVTPAVRDEQGNITIPAVMGTRTVPVYQSMAYDSPEIMANIIAELKSLRARLKALEAKVGA